MLDALDHAVDQRQLRDAFGTFASGVVAIAAELDGRPVGMAVSSFTSVSLDPPLVSVALASTSRTWPGLRCANQLGVTVLAAHQASICRTLAGPFDRRFEGVPYSVSPSGAIAVREGLATFECTIVQEIEAGDHVIALLRVRHVRRGPESTTPLVFHRSGFATSLRVVR